MYVKLAVVSSLLDPTHLSIQAEVHTPIYPVRFNPLRICILAL